MRLFRHLVLAATVVLSLAACGGNEPAPEAAAGALSPAELGWVREYSRWTIDVWEEELGHEPGARLVRECRDRLAEVGEPPTGRLRRAADRAEAACPLLRRRGSTRRALDVIEDADALILPLLLESRSLPFRAGVGDRSRADVNLSDLASQEAETPLEVRCWSRPEWRRVVRERNAWTDSSDDSGDLLGFGDEDAARIHLPLEQCNVLARLDRADVLEWTRERRLAAADAVATLSHEIQHFVLPDAEEAEVECAALDTAGPLAAELGASAAEEDELVELYRTELYPELPDEYRGDCDA